MLFGEAGVPYSYFFGLAGVAVYVSAYFALQAGRIKGQGYMYPGLVAFAACLVLIGLVENFNLPSAVIQVTYIAISVFGIVRFYLLTHHIRFSEEELGFLNAILPEVPKLQSRRFLDLGAWKNEASGAELTREGEAVESLLFLSAGSAEVSVSRKCVAQLGSGSLIGEMSVIMHAPASATVALSAPSRLFSVEAGKLEAFLARNLNVRYALENRIANQIGEKLIRSNAALSAKG